MRGRRRQLIPEGISEAFAEIDGVRLRYLHGGSGQPLLFLHGLMGFSFSWSENLTEFSRRYQVLAPDFPNVGYSGRSLCDPGLHAAAKRMLRLMDELQVAKATVIGTSHGGTVGIKMAVLAPERIERLVLAAPSTPWSERDRWQLRLFTSALGSRLARLFYVTPATLVSGILRFRMYGRRRQPLPGTGMEYMRAIKVRGTVEHLLRFVKCWEADIDELDGELDRLRSFPVLLVWGEHDVVVPLWTMQKLAERLPHATSRVIASAGHLPYEELPNEFNRTVMEWLEQSAGGAASHLTTRAHSSVPAEAR